MYIRVLVVPQEAQWLAQAVDFDIAVQGPTDELAIAAFVRVLRAHYLRDRALGRKPFENLPDAPQHFAEAWERIVQTNSRVIPAEHGDEMPPAYIIEALGTSSLDFNAGQ
jgi:hypothetical protein